MILGARFSNFEAWVAQPTDKPISQGVWASRALLQEAGNLDQGTVAGIRITSGVFQVWRSAGLTTNAELFSGAIGLLVLSAVFIIGGWYHHHGSVPRRAWFNNSDVILSHHLSAVIGLGSIAWAGHLLHVAWPTEVLLICGCDPHHLPSPQALSGVQYVPVILGQASGLLTLEWEALLPAISFLGGFNHHTGGLYLSDVIHHHLAVGVLALIAGHLYRTQYALGTTFNELLVAHGSIGLTAWHAQLAINLAVVGSASIATAHFMANVPAYAYLRTDWATVLNLFVHHMWIGGFFIVGASAHGAIYLIQEYQPWSYTAVERVLSHRSSIISHLNWVCIFLGFHSFGLYIHNDTLAALGRTSDLFADGAISLKPFFGLDGQNVLASSADVISGVAAHSASAVTTADTLVHHVHAFTIHVTALILLKGVLFARSSRLVADKAILGFRFPCDGPGRGGSCQISSWDHVFLGSLWMYNAISVIIFHFSWKQQSSVWAAANDGELVYQTAGTFENEGITIGGWLRDFLWSQSAQVIQSYGSAAGSYGLLFLGAHFVWAFSLMFLFSGRGYWQELIETIVGRALATHTTFWAVLSQLGHSSSHDCQGGKFR